MKSEDWRCHSEAAGRRIFPQPASKRFFVAYAPQNDNITFFIKSGRGGTRVSRRRLAGSHIVTRATARVAPTTTFRCFPCHSEAAGRRIFWFLRNVQPAAARIGGWCKRESSSRQGRCKSINRSVERHGANIDRAVIEIPVSRVPAAALFRSRKKAPFSSISFVQEQKDMAVGDISTIQ